MSTHNPGQTPDQTPDQTPGQTPDQTPGQTPDQAIDWFKRLGTDSLIAKHIHNWRDENLEYPRPLPMVRQWAISPDIQSAIDWIGTIQLWINHQNHWNKLYSTECVDERRKIIDDARKCIAVLTNLVQYYYTNSPSCIEKTSIMPLDIVETVTQIIIDAKKIIEYLELDKK